MTNRPPLEDIQGRALTGKQRRRLTQPYTHHATLDIRLPLLNKKMDDPETARFLYDDTKMVDTILATIPTSLMACHMTDSKLGRHTPSAQEIVAALDLEPHLEGGYYRRTFQADHHPMVETEGGRRYLMTSIYYLLTSATPIGHFHLNQSDIVHYYHLGDAIQYILIYPDGTLKTLVMGSDVTTGQCLQLHVPGGVWKASQLMDGSAGYGLISEAVSPGFDYADMQLGSQQKLSELFPEHSVLFEKLTRE